MTVGIVGAGQLGRMLALAGYPLGLDFLCLDPARDAPAGQVAPLLQGAFTDRRLLARLARRCEVITFDWENVSVAHLSAASRPRRPPAAPGRAPARRSRRSPPARTGSPRSACSSGSASPPRAGARSARRPRWRAPSPRS